MGVHPYWSHLRSDSINSLSDMDELTQAQNDMLHHIEGLLSEHFDAHVLIVDVSDVNYKGDYLTVGHYNGGPAHAMGLCQYQIEQIKKNLE